MPSPPVPTPIPRPTSACAVTGSRDHNKICAVSPETLRRARVSRGPSPCAPLGPQPLQGPVTFASSQTALSGSFCTSYKQVYAEEGVDEPGPWADFLSDERGQAGHDAFLPAAGRAAKTAPPLTSSSEDRLLRRLLQEELARQLEAFRCCIREELSCDFGADPTTVVLKQERGRDRFLAENVETEKELRARSRGAPAEAASCRPLPIGKHPNVFSPAGRAPAERSEEEFLAMESVANQPQTLPFGDAKCVLEDTAEGWSQSEAVTVPVERGATMGRQDQDAMSLAGTPSNGFSLNVAEIHRKRTMVKKPKNAMAEVVRIALTGNVSSAAVDDLEQYLTMTEPEREGYLAKLTDSHVFQTSCVFVILFDAVMTCLATQYEVTHVQEAPLGFLLSEYLCLAFYILELSMKLLVHRFWFFFNESMWWNWFDTVLVFVALFQSLMTYASPVGSVNLTFARMLRLLRLGKVMRVLRLLQFVNNLKIMLNSLLGSLTALFWSLVMLTLIIYMFGLIFVQNVAAFLREGGLSDLGPDRAQSLLASFGSMDTAMLSMYKACTGGDDWSIYYELLRPTGSLSCALYLAFVAFSNLFFLNVITGLFLDKAMQAARPDKIDQVRERRKVQDELTKELTTICFQIINGSPSNGGDSATMQISIRDFETQMDNEASDLRTFMECYGMDRDDADAFFRMLIGAGRAVELRHFVESFVWLSQGGRTSLEILGLAKRSKQIYLDLQSMKGVLQELALDRRERSESLRSRAKANEHHRNVNAKGSNYLKSLT